MTIRATFALTCIFALTAFPVFAEDAPKCEEGEALVPPTGDDGFVMGKGTKAERHVVLTKGFCVDQKEVIVKSYKLCVDAGNCKAPWQGDLFSMYPRKDDYPVNLVTWTMARAYCAFVGKRLPSEAEWEWMATGPEQSKYPWGNAPAPSCDLVDYTNFGAPKSRAGGDVGCHGGGPSVVGAHPKGDRMWSGKPVSDLAGNVWEWVEDSFSPAKASTVKVVDPVVRNTSPVHPLRGGAWNRSYAAMEVTYRAAAIYKYAVPGIGVRCVRGAPLPGEPPDHEGVKATKSQASSTALHANAIGSGP